MEKTGHGGKDIPKGKGLFFLKKVRCGGMIFVVIYYCYLKFHTVGWLV